VLELAIPHVAVHAAVHGEHLEVAVEAPDLLDAAVQVADEGVAPALHEPQLEVAVPRQQVLVRRSAPLQVRVAEQRELHALLVEGGDRDVEGPEVGCGFFADEDDAVGGEEGLCGR
jgi:hypothetical protein